MFGPTPPSNFVVRSDGVTVAKRQPTTDSLSDQAQRLADFKLVSMTFVLYAMRLHN
jgi:hypothetical protein